MKPGFDGADFAVERIRDHEGRNKRELVRLVRYDVCTRLFRYNPPLLELDEYEAAVRLQCEAQLAATPILQRAGSLQTGKSDFGLSEAVMDAAASVRAAQRVTGLQWAVVDSVVLNNLNLSRVAKAFGLAPRRVLPRLRSGLQMLAKHYGLRS